MNLICLITRFSVLQHCHHLQKINNFFWGGMFALTLTTLTSFCSRYLFSRDYDKHKENPVLFFKTSKFPLKKRPVYNLMKSFGTEDKCKHFPKCIHFFNVYRRTNFSRTQQLSAL